MRDRSVLVAEHGSGDPVQAVRAAVTQGRQQLLEGVLTFAEHHDIGGAICDIVPAGAE